LLVVRTPDGDGGALALARRHAILGKLESQPSSAVEAAVGESRGEPQQPRTQYAGAPAASGPTSASAPASISASARGESADAAPLPDLPPDESLFAGVSHAEVSSTSTVASVLAAANRTAGKEASPFARAEAPSSARQADVPGRSDGRDGRDGRDGIGARLVADTRGPVIPPRPEPFMPRRRPDYPEDSPRSAAVGMGSVGSAAVATDAARHPDAAEARVHIERDPSVNKSLLLRLIAGVRGL
jgi:hypothetical protein